MGGWMDANTCMFLAFRFVFGKLCTLFEMDGVAVFLPVLAWSGRQIVCMVVGFGGGGGV